MLYDSIVTHILYQALSLLLERGLHGIVFTSIKQNKILQGLICQFNSLSLPHDNENARACVCACARAFVCVHVYVSLFMCNSLHSVFLYLLRDSEMNAATFPATLTIPGNVQGKLHRLYECFQVKSYRLITAKREVLNTAHLLRRRVCYPVTTPVNSTSFLV